MNLSICNIWTAGNENANLVGWNGQPEQINFWPLLAIVPV